MEEYTVDGLEFKIPIDYLANLFFSLLTIVLKATTQSHVLPLSSLEYKNAARLWFQGRIFREIAFGIRLVKNQSSV